MTTAASLASYASSFPNFRNRIINGNFDIWQRGTSQTTSDYGSVDRWRPTHAGSTKTASQQAFTLGQTDVPGNPKYYLRHVVSSVAGSGNFCLIIHKIEGVTTLAGQTATLSFWAKADSNKNIATEFLQYFGTGGSPSALVNTIGVTTHNLTTSWQKFTATVAVPSISGKTLGSNGDDRLELNFWFETGSDFSSRTNSLGNQSGTFDIAQVQLEEGSSATPFEHRPIGMELSLCQRYYEVITMGTGNSLGVYTSGAGVRFYTQGVKYATEKRAQPSITITAVNSYWTVPGIVAVSANGAHTFTALSPNTMGHGAYSNRPVGNNTPVNNYPYIYENAVTHEANAEL